MRYPRLNFFDLPDKSEPDWRSTIYGEIIPRAVAILEHRSRAEVEYGVSTVNYLLSPAISDQISDQSSESIVRITTPAAFLRRLMPKISIIEQESMPNATWPEYFAILAISLAGRAFEYSEIVADREIRRITFDPPRVSAHPDTAAQSMEAVVVAETLLDLESRVTETVASTIQLSKHEAAIRGNERRYQLWEELVEYFLAGDFSSKSEAIHRFYNALSPEDRKVVCPKAETTEQVVRTLRPKLKDLGE